MLEASVSGRSGWNFLLASYCEIVVNMVSFSLHLFYCTAILYPPQRPLADYSLHYKVQEKETTDPVVDAHRGKKNQKNNNPNTEK